MDKMTDPAKPALAPVPIWRCTKSECKAWIREELAETDKPFCPICKGPMIRSMKHLPKLVKKTPRKKKTESNPW